MVYSDKWLTHEDQLDSYYRPTFLIIAPVALRRLSEVGSHMLPYCKMTPKCNAYLKTVEEKISQS